MNVITEKKIYEILSEVMDPEVPVLSVLDLGIIREVKIKNETVYIKITPTYVACPAMGVIEMNIRTTLIDHQIPNHHIETILSPAWTTEWMTEEGKKKLIEYGIAAPLEKSRINSLLFSEEKNIPCPRCKSTNSKKISNFGSTACKALFQCEDCREPFDYFKCH